MENIPKTPNAYREWWINNAPVPYGECWCGCGELTNIEAKSCAARGIVGGEPKRYAHGHNARLPLDRYVVQNTGYISDCWVWQGAKTDMGYAAVSRDGKQFYAHRFHYIQSGRRIPEGMHLDHLCRHKACVNPEHLEPVTHTENSRRGLGSKLTEADVRSIRKVCKQGRKTQAELAREYGMSTAQISRVVSGQRWTLVE